MIHYEDYKPFANHRLPTKITLEKESMKIRMLINWAP